MPARKKKRPDLWRDVKKQHRRSWLRRRDRNRDEAADLAVAVRAVSEARKQQHRKDRSHEGDGAADAARSTVFRFRRQAAPLVLLATVWTAGVALARTGTGTITVPVLAVLALAGMLLAARRFPGPVRLHAAVVVTAGGAWLTLASTGTVAHAALAAGGALLALPWWLRHSIRNPDGDDTAPDHTAEQIWAQRVAAQGKALPGSVLTVRRDVDNGWRAIIRLVPGTHTTDDAIAVTPRIASAYEKPVTNVIVEPTPDGVSSHAGLLMLHRNPLQQVQHWPGPSLDPATGVAPVGVHSDGATARFRFWAPGSGAVHSLVSGAPDSGKSRFLEQLLANAAHCTDDDGRGLVVSWLIDPQNGQSLPRWIDYVDWAALDHEHARVMLTAAERVMYARSRHLARIQWADERGRAMRGSDSFTPTGDMPLLHIVIDEAHEILTNPEAVRVVSAIGKMGRKTGIAVALVTQLPSVRELGGEMAVRSMVSSGNVVVFRTADRVTSGMAFSGALPVDPSALPREFPNGERTSGLGYVLGPQARTAPMRSWLDPDPHQSATTAPGTTLEDRAGLAAGEPYRNRRDDGGGTGIAPVTPAAEPGTGTGGSEAGTVRDAVLAVLTEHGRLDRGTIIKRSGRSTRQVADVLRELVDEGTLRNPDRGVYQLPGGAEDRETAA